MTRCDYSSSNQDIKLMTDMVVYMWLGSEFVLQHSVKVEYCERYR